VTQTYRLTTGVPFSSPYAPSPWYDANNRRTQSRRTWL